jgi:iron(III) transport system ATP-binding protein
VKAVDDVSLTVEPGHILSVVGPSGCGKTTLLRLLAGFESPDEGEVDLGDRLVAGLGVWVPPEARQVGMVFQDYALFPHMTVAQNVEFGLMGWPKPEREARVNGLLEMVHLAGLAQRRPHQLSGGEQQRVALVRSLAPRPVAIFMDEPFSNLDTNLREELRQEVKSIVGQFGTTTIHVTHDQEQALYMGDEVAVMRAGRLEQVGPPEEVFHRPASPFVASFLGMADFLPVVVGDEGLSTEVGFLKGESGFSSGAQARLMLRPDQVGMEPSSDGGCFVEERAFRGLDYLYTLVLPSGTRLHSLQHHGVYYSAGDGVKVSIRMSNPPICFKADGQ